MILWALQEWFYGVMYTMQSSICNVIDFIKDIFYKLCGLDTVTKNGEEVDLVSELIGANSVRQTFFAILLIGVILLTLFCVIALIRANYQNSDKKTRATVLIKAGQSFIIFLLVPFLLLAGILLTNTIMSAINMSMNQFMTGQPTIGGQMLVTTGFDAYKGSPGLREEIERKFISGELDYNNLDVVKQYYDIWKMNYVVGILGGIVILVMFALSCMTFIQRIFDIILLFVISPISISTVPLDDGNRFKLWKDMVVAKVLSAYGIIIVMNLFFLIIPQVSQMTFFENGFQNGVVYILFLIGGAFAVTKANLVIAQLTGAQSGGRELAQMIYNIRSGIAFGKSTAGAVGGLLGRTVGGSDYLENRKKGGGRIESLNMSMHSNRNQKTMSEKSDTKAAKAKQIAGAPLRIATMPIGMVKDLMSGGMVQAGKNFGPRLRNAFTGTSLVNCAEVKVKPGNGDKGQTATGYAKDATATADTPTAKKTGAAPNPSKPDNMRSDKEDK